VRRYAEEAIALEKVKGKVKNVKATVFFKPEL